jgi:hypothetical protein
LLQFFDKNARALDHQFKISVIDSSLDDNRWAFGNAIAVRTYRCRYAQALVLKKLHEKMPSRCLPQPFRKF